MLVIELIKLAQILISARQRNCLKFLLKTKIQLTKNL